jgi:hypothetical protein
MCEFDRIMIFACPRDTTPSHTAIRRPCFSAAGLRTGYYSLDERVNGAFIVNQKPSRWWVFSVLELSATSVQP